MNEYKTLDLIYKFIDKEILEVIKDNSVLIEKEKDDIKIEFDVIKINWTHKETNSICTTHLSHKKSLQEFNEFYKTHKRKLIDHKLINFHIVESINNKKSYIDFLTIKEKNKLTIFPIDSVYYQVISNLSKADKIEIEIMLTLEPYSKKKKLHIKENMYLEEIVIRINQSYKIINLF